MEAGKLELEPIEFNIGSLMDSFGTEIAVKASEKDVEIICPANPVLDHWYKADPGRIRQVLHNLVGNAIKFTEQGEVAVYLDVIEEGEAESLIKIRVTDTGIGLTSEQISRLMAAGPTSRFSTDSPNWLSACR